MAVAQLVRFFGITEPAAMDMVEGHDTVTIQDASNRSTNTGHEDDPALTE